MSVPTVDHFSQLNTSVMYNVLKETCQHIYSIIRPHIIIIRVSSLTNLMNTCYDSRKGNDRLLASLKVALLMPNATADYILYSVPIHLLKCKN